MSQAANLDKGLSLGESFEAGRNRLLNIINSCNDPQEKLDYLIQLRKAEWAVPGYRNSLSILSDTTYQDRKHFLLELIQNADDAAYEENIASIIFIIQLGCLVIQYNEKGFSFDDVFSITDTGKSTKKKDKFGASSFIGEKGIGFKSVFALAQEVEIESPPWHFKLTKKQPIIPVPINHKTIQRGTQLKITFTNPDIIDDIADELDSFIGGSIESFLFLRKLSVFTVEDHRYSPPLCKILEADPHSRSGDNLQLKTLPDDSKRDYIIYSEQLEFPAELVAERWEQLAGIGPLKRSITMAALLQNEDVRLQHGKMFCFLPTRVSLPVPIYLQLDGVTTAAREELHDLKYNAWNRYLVQQLPDFLLHAIIFMRNNPNTANSLPDYIPHSEGMDQLKDIFLELKELLKHTAWVKTCDDGSDAWAKPDQIVIADEFLYSWIDKDADYRKKIEERLGKHFMSPEWAFNKEWEFKWTQYGIDELQEYHIADIFANVSLPKNKLENEETLLSLYKYMLQMKCFNDYTNPDVLELFQNAPIFLIANEGFAPLKVKGNDVQVYYLSTQAVQRQTGIEGLDCYRLVEPQYTYMFRIEKGSDEKNAEIVRINARNKTVRTILERLNIEDLNNDTLLTNLQIPWLLNPNNAKTEFDNNRYSLLNAIFEAFNNKREYDSEYLEQLERLKDAFFRSNNDKYLPLHKLTLPAILRMETADDIFYRAGTPNIIIPAEYLEPTSSSSRYRSKDENANIRKYREKWRDFLMKCGLRVRPGWKTETKKYESCNEFRIKDYTRWKAWKEKIKNEYTEINPVEISYVLLDEITLNLLHSPERDIEKLAFAIYDSWKTKYSSLLNSDTRSKTELLPGYLNVKHKRRTENTIQIKDTLWAGIEPEQIPLMTINKIAVLAGMALRIDKNQVEALKFTSNVLTLVPQTDNLLDDYHIRYLESLNLPTPTMKDVNQLWHNKDSKYYDDIIQVAIELLKMNIVADGLLIYDKTKNEFRPYDDFRLGKATLNDIPMIEKQYGDSGRTLGQLLHLRSESKLSSYRQLIEKIYARLPRSLEQNHASILSLLNEWSILGEGSRKDLIQAAEKGRKAKNLDLPIIITYNQVEWALQLKEAGYPVLILNIPEMEIFKLQRAAHELGFLSIEEAGQLELKGERSLNESEAQLFLEYLNAYKAVLGSREIAVLEEKLTIMGKKENLPAHIKRVQSAHRAIELGSKSLHISLDLPFLENQQIPAFLVSERDTIPEILAHLLSILEFAPYRSVYRDLMEMQSDVEPVYELPSEVNKDKFKDKKEYQQDPVKIAKEIKDNLVDNRTVPDKDKYTPWKTGLSPDEEEIYREKQLESYRKSLEEGPQEYEKKVRLHNQRSQKSESKRQVILDPGAVNPKEFIKNEYDGRCQICGTLLLLVNGDKWVETYHIIEKRGQEWLKDRPFNFLGLCPNCHALAKHGGRNFNSLFELARELEQGQVIPQEVPHYHMDAYVTKVFINGEEKELVMSKAHLNHMAVVFADLIAFENDVAAMDDQD